MSDEKLRVETDEDDLRILRSTLVNTTELSVSDDYESGGDPYNSTGRHVVIKAKLELGD